MHKFKAQYTHTPVVAQVSGRRISVSYVVLRRNHLLLRLSTFPLHYTLLPPSSILSGKWQETPEVWSEDGRAEIKKHTLTYPQLMIERTWLTLYHLSFFCRCSVVFVYYKKKTFTVLSTSPCLVRAVSPSVRAAFRSSDTQSSSRQIFSHRKWPINIWIDS